METNQQQPTPESIASKFSSVLRQWLSAEEMAAIVQTNATPEYAGDIICASHNYCDANMAMLEAMTDLGLNPDPTSEADADLWNRAWKIAKDGGFSTL